MKEIKRHNTKLDLNVYTNLKELEVKLLQSGVDISLNEILQGCIRYVYDKGITNNDLEYFDHTKK